MGAICRLRSAPRCTKMTPHNAGKSPAPWAIDRLHILVPQCTKKSFQWRKNPRCHGWLMGAISRLRPAPVGSEMSKKKQWKKRLQISVPSAQRKPFPREKIFGSVASQWVLYFSSKVYNNTVLTAKKFAARRPAELRRLGPKSPAPWPINMLQILVPRCSKKTLYQR
jgi:hypothetical protein